MNKKKGLALFLSLVLILAAVSGTLAYLTDTDEATNTFTVGKVDIAIRESKIYTNNTSVAEDEIREDAKNYADYLENGAGKNVVPGSKFNKCIYVDNIGKNDAYYRVRMIVTRDQFNSFYFTENTTRLEENYFTKGIIAHYPNGTTKDYSDAVNGKTTDFTAIKADTEWNALEYIYTCTKVLEAGKLAEYSPVYQFTMKYDLDNEDLVGLNTDILVYADAIQTEGFADYEAAFAAFDKQNGYATQDAFENALTAAKPGETINIGNATMDMTGLSIPAGVTIAGSGADKTKVNVPANTAGTRVTGLVINGAGTTIKDVTLVENDAISSDQYAGVAAVKVGDTTFDGVVINSTGYTSAIVVDSFKTGVVTIANSTLTSAFKTIHIADGANGKVVIDNTEITGTYTFNVNSGNSPDLVIEVTNSKLHGWTSYSAIKSVSFTNTEFSKGNSGYDFIRPYADTTFTGCSFDADFRMGAGAAISITINDCTFNGVKITADNLYTMLTDLENIKTCTITVDGVTVTNFGA